jgi:hypothetical protein
MPSWQVHGAPPGTRRTVIRGAAALYQPPCLKLNLTMLLFSRPYSAGIAAARTNRHAAGKSINHATLPHSSHVPWFV